MSNNRFTVSFKAIYCNSIFSRYNIKHPFFRHVFKLQYIVQFADAFISNTHNSFYKLLMNKHDA